jgi:hypothetical protein
MVTINSSWTEGDVTGKRYTKMNVTIALTGQGSVNNLIPATIFGLETIVEGSTFVGEPVANTYTGFVGVPDATGANLLLMTSSGGALAPSDIAETLTGTITGILAHS